MAIRKSGPITFGSILKVIQSTLFFPLNFVATGTLFLTKSVINATSIVEAFFVKTVLGRKLEKNPFWDDLYKKIDGLYKSQFRQTFEFALIPLEYLSGRTRDIISESGTDFSPNKPGHTEDKADKQSIKDNSSIIRNKSGKKPSTSIKPESSILTTNSATVSSHHR